MFKFIKNCIKFFLLKLKSKKNGLKIYSMFIDLKTNIGKKSIIMEGTIVDKNTNIGKYCYIGRYCYITKSDIGNYCSIANNVSIGQGEHDLEQISTNSIFYGKDAYKVLTKKKCEIGNDVWIGVDSIIKRGVKIGDGAVIGSNSVVTKNIPSFAIAVGSPAKVIKYRFCKDKIELIKSSSWWNKDFLEAKSIIEKIQNNKPN